MQLLKLGFQMHPLEPCVYHGVLGTNADDGICGGHDWLHSRIEQLRKSLPSGSYKQRKFVFTGIQLEQLPDLASEHVRKIM